MVVGFAIGLLVAGLPLAVLSFMLSNELNRLNSFEGLNLTVDKGSYKLGETIEVTLENRFDRQIFVSTGTTFVVEKKNESWIPAYYYMLPEYLRYCGQYGPPVNFAVSNDTSFHIAWNQTIMRCVWSTREIIHEQVLPDLYRLKMMISFRDVFIEDLPPDETLTIYSNEFTIHQW